MHCYVKVVGVLILKEIHVPIRQKHEKLVGLPPLLLPPSYSSFFFSPAITSFDAVDMVVGPFHCSGSAAIV